MSSLYIRINRGFGTVGTTGTVPTYAYSMGVQGALFHFSITKKVAKERSFATFLSIYLLYTGYSQPSASATFPFKSLMTIGLSSSLIEYPFLES